MAAVKISNTNTATYTTQIEGLRDINLNIEGVEKSFASDGGDEEFDVVGARVSGTATFDNVSAFNQALGGAEANLVINNRVKGGAATRDITVKNATFIGTRIAVPVKQDRQGGTYQCQVRGRAGASDTIDTMITEAAGA